MRKHDMIFNGGLLLIFIGGAIIGWAIGESSSKPQGASGVWMRLERVEPGHFQVREIVNNGEVLTNLMISISLKP